MKTCPHCGAAIHEKVSYCPYCAKTVNQCTKAIQPWYIPRLALYAGGLIVLAAVLALALTGWRISRPQTYESDTGELVYGDLRLCLAGMEFSAPVPLRSFHCQMDQSYRSPAALYAAALEDGELAADRFMEHEASVAAEVRCSDIYVSITCTEPQQHNEYIPDAAAVTFLDFMLLAPGEHEAELILTVTMKNGDTIRMTQAQQFTSVSVYTYTAQDAPIGTIEELQALVDRVSEEISEYDRLHLYLPAVTYKGGLVLDRHANLYGSVGPDGQRTTFTDPTEVQSALGVPEFSGIVFQGSGQGVGVRASGTVRLHLKDCRVSGWETGFLASENAWINAVKTVFEDNTVGLCFDAVDTPMVSDDFYTENVFQNNGTAVLLERVSNDTSLKFPDCRFTGNGADIDNQCGQALDLSEALFE